MYGARLCGDMAIIPCRDTDGRLWGFQRIQPDGKKLWKTGQRKDGCFHLIGSVDKADVIIICEGFATGASLFEATGHAIICAFDAGNLVKVASEVKKKWPSHAYIVAADNDAWTMKQDTTPWNPGVEKATEAAKKCIGSIVIPQFRDTSSKPTDFNDLFILEGGDAVKRQIQATKTVRAAIIPLGFRGEEYFFTSSDNQTICVLTSFSDVQLFKLMRKEYWEAVYPSTKDGIDWQMAKSDLMDQCRRRGVFESRHVRGAGIWMDQGRLVINLGDRLQVDGKEMPVNAIKSKFFYSLGRALPETKVEPLDLIECELLVHICQKFKWLRPEYCNYVAGMLVISKICGALPIRPHMWFTGGSQTGKSTLLERLVFPTLKGYSLYFLGGSSEAGVRQSLASDSVPIVFDEFETNGKKSTDLIQSCIELMRASWSESQGYITKGSAGGTAAFYQPRFSALVSSIRTNLVNDADRSRFTVVELKPHGNDTQHWKELSAMLEQYDQTYVDRLFARTLKMLPIILENAKTLKRALAQKGSARFGDQHGMLLAGFYSLINDGLLDEIGIEKLIDNLGLEDERAESGVTDESECLDFIFNKKTRHSSLSGQTTEMSIGDLIETVRKSPVSCDAEKKTLKNLGIAVESDDLIVASSHPELRNLFLSGGGERWANCWGRTLSRLVGARKGRESVRFGAATSRYLRIPLQR
jgi:putative DNA primase/helicase